MSSRDGSPKTQSRSLQPPVLSSRGNIRNGHQWRPKHVDTNRKNL